MRAYILLPSAATIRKRGFQHISARRRCYAFTIYFIDDDAIDIDARLRFPEGARRAVPWSVICRLRAIAAYFNACYRELICRQSSLLRAKPHNLIYRLFDR